MTPMSRRLENRRAFTLVEVMVVFAIISILVTMLLLGAVGLRHAAVRTQCVNNLHNIGLGYKQFADIKGETAFKGDYTWVTLLKPYLENHDEVFWCPNQEVKNFADDVPKGFIRVNENSFPEYGGTRNIPIAKDGPRMRLTSRYPQNSPPGTYYIEMEDWTDWNWCDLTMKYWPSDDGSGFNIQPVGTTGAGFHFDLMGPDGTTMLYQNFKPPNYPIVTIPGGMSRTSYAITSQVASLTTGDADKVLAVEYNTKVVANVFGSSPPDYWPTYNAPRHRGTLNVLMFNGAVKTMLPDDIDPRDTLLYPRHWLPTVPGPF